MRETIERLGLPAEAAIVTALGFAGFLATAPWSFFESGAPAPGGLVALSAAAQVAIALFAALLFLEVRGWPLYLLRVHATWSTSLSGLTLVLLYYLIFNYVVLIATGGVNDPGPPFRGADFTVASVLLTIAAIAVHAALFELIVTGYVMHAVGARFGTVFAVFASAGLRMLFHLPAGELALLAMAPAGILFALFYWKAQNLWPPILAHAAINLFAVLPIWPS